MSAALRIVFMGTPGFAVTSLAKLQHSRHEVVAVITAPDRPAGRGRKLRSSEVKEYALSQELPILQPEKLKNKEFLDELESYGANFFVVVAFRMLPEQVWSMPEFGTINLHASLLPQYRGAAPINWALINGEEHTGVTTFFINAEIDKGKIIDYVQVKIEPEDTAAELHDRLKEVGAELVLKTAEEVASGKVDAKSQKTDRHDLRPAPKLNNENRRINWERSAEDIRNLIRGLCPYPAATSVLHMPEEGEIGCKLYAVHLEESDHLEPGEIRTDNRSYIKVGTGTYDISIDDLHLSGKRRMSLKDLLNGFEIEADSLFLS